MRRKTSHPIPALKDGCLLHGTPPSLWGIVPSRTGIDEAREILRAKGVLRACQEYRAERTGSTGIACHPHFNLNHEDGLVKFVEFRPSHPITIAEVIERHGPPEGILSVFTDFPDGNIYTVLLVYLRADLDHPEPGRAGAEDLPRDARHHCRAHHVQQTLPRGCEERAPRVVGRLRRLPRDRRDRRLKRSQGFSTILSR